MPTKPLTTYNWDDNQTNSAQPSAGLLTDGYAIDAIPASSHFNYQLNSLGEWVGYFEAVTDALDHLESITDLTLTIDSDGTSTTNRVLINHDVADTELFSLDETANFRINAATVGTNGTATIAIKTGVSPTTAPTDVVQIYSEDFAAGDARLFVKSESGGTISIGNDAIRNVNTDGTLIVASEKHLTLDIDSDNDGTDGLLTVRANGSTTAMTVTEAGLVTATGNVIGTNILSTNITDQLAISQGIILSKAINLTVCTDAEVTILTNTADGTRWIRAAQGATTPVLIAIGTNSDIVTFTIPVSENLTAADAWASRSIAVNYFSVDADGTFGVGVAAAGALYTSPASGDYATWTSRTSGTAQTLSCLSVGGGYWCAYSGSNVNVIRYNDTTDPTDAWSASTSGLDGTTTFAGAAFGADLHVAITSDHEIITTANPSGAWTSRTNPTTATWRGMNFDGTRFWAYGDAGKLITSTDGITWTDVTISGATARINGACVLSIGAQKVYLAFEGSGSTGCLWVGTTLGTWSRHPIDVTPSNLDLPMTYDPTIKRLFMAVTGSDLAFSKKIV